MNSKGQAALEYLMTYGWALVIIVIVAGILFFIAVTPQGGVVCNSSDPTKVVVQSYNITKTGGPNRVVLSNGTGGTLTAYNYVCVNGGGGGSASTITCTAFPVSPATSGTLSGGSLVTVNVTLVPNGGSGSTYGAMDSNSGVFFAYTDQFGYTKYAKITCSGAPV